MDLRVPSDPTTGVVDVETRSGIGPWQAVRSRVVPSCEGVDHSFTPFHFRGVPQPVFEGMVAGMDEELHTLKALLEA